MKYDNFYEWYKAEKDSLERFIETMLKEDIIAEQVEEATEQHAQYDVYVGDKKIHSFTGRNPNSFSQTKIRKMREQMNKEMDKALNRIWNKQ